MTYEEWCESVGIIPDTESHEAWDYQQKIIGELEKKLQIHNELEDMPWRKE